MYTTYSDYLQRLFPRKKIQKISVNIGNSCPNRDGTIGTGGCIYCNNASFTPAYCLAGDSVALQIEKGKKFFGRKYPDMYFLPYFQSYTVTNDSPEHLQEIFSEALRQERVEGLIIGTRPDCLPEKIMDLLAALNKIKPVIVELGAESSHDATLKRINRGHDWQTLCQAVENLASAGISCGLHLIAGLPGEDEMMILETVERACQLPIDTLKVHQMQVIRNTPLHRMMEEGAADIHLFTVEEYLSLCVKIISRVPKRIAIERFVSQAPPELLVAPKWGLKNYQFTNLLSNLLLRQSDIAKSPKTI